MLTIGTKRFSQHLPVSESLAFCTANSPGSLSNKKYALLEKTVSSDHRLAAFGSRSRISTLQRTKTNRKLHYRAQEKGKNEQLKFIA